jgi:hypothetical protein
LARIAGQCGASEVKAREPIAHPSNTTTPIVATSAPVATETRLGQRMTSDGPDDRLRA